MVTQSDLNEIDKRVGKLEAVVDAAGGLVGRDLCEQKEGRVMDAVDRLNSTTRDLSEQMKELRRDVSNGRKQKMVWVVGLATALVLGIVSILLNHLAKGGG